MEENSKRLIVMSILAYAVGTFILAAGLLTKSSLSITVFYIITMVLIICAMLALFRKSLYSLNIYVLSDYSNILLAISKCQVSTSKVALFYGIRWR